jgi:hypothetical protein
LIVPTLAHQRCFNHATREAAACCPECHRFYCRECITEHEDRLLCASCLKKIVQPPFTQRRGFVSVVRLLQVGGGVLLVWCFFYLLGWLLLSIPSSFHEGTFWQGHWLDER